MHAIAQFMQYVLYKRNFYAFCVTFIVVIIITLWKGGDFFQEALSVAVSEQ